MHLTHGPMCTGWGGALRVLDRQRAALRSELPIGGGQDPDRPG